MRPTKSQVTRAGKILMSSKSQEDRDRALELINEWRTNHLSPLTVIKNHIVKILELNAISPVLISQRLKRLTSIEYKLDLNKTMALGGMQDIGGFRVVLKDTKDLNKFKRLIELHSETKRYKIEYSDDYVTDPRETGYRSIHYIYTYKSKKVQYDGVKLELQIRTKLQHNWATAVETAGIYTQTSLKSGQGPDDWINFFQTISSLFAMKEKLAVLDKHKDFKMEVLMTRCFQLTEKLKVLEILNALRVSARHIDIEKVEGDYYIINISFVKKRVSITVYPKNKYSQATAEYLRLEKNAISIETAVVLVAANSIKSLKKAYPSYFLDTSEFIEALERVNQNCKALKLI